MVSGMHQIDRLRTRMNGHSDVAFAQDTEKREKKSLQASSGSSCCNSALAFFLLKEVMAKHSFWKNLVPQTFACLFCHVFLGFKRAPAKVVVHGQALFPGSTKNQELLLRTAAGWQVSCCESGGVLREVLITQTFAF
jgi:hypothetical protein